MHMKISPLNVNFSKIDACLQWTTNRKEHMPSEMVAYRESNGHVTNDATCYQKCWSWPHYLWGAISP